MTYRDQRSLEHAKQQLAHWRTENSAPTPIPGEIWEKAVQLARRHGVGQVARALRLDHGALKRRVEAPDPATTNPQSTPAATFIELLPVAPPVIIGRCELEVESRRGDELRLTLSEIAPSTLATLIREVLA